MRPEESADRWDSGTRGRMYADQTPVAIGRRDHVARVHPRLQPGGHECALHIDHARHSLMPMVAGHDQQHIVARGAQTGRFGDDHAGIRIHCPKRSEMLGPTERLGMLNMIRFTHPDHRRRCLARQDGEEPLSHHPVASDVAGDVEPVGKRHPAGTLTAGTMVEMAVAIGVMRVGCAGRDVAEDDRPTERRETLRHRRHCQRRAGDRAAVLQEVRNPALRRTRRPSSISTTVLPYSPCPAGRQPLAIVEQTSRVGEGKTERCAVYRVASTAKAERQGISSGVTRSWRPPSRMTTPARCMAVLPNSAPQHPTGAPILPRGFA